MNLTKAILLTFLFGCTSYAQWGAGLNANFKNEEPKFGVGFIISRNLPFQWPAIGLKVKFEADLFQQNIIGRYLHRGNRRIELSEKNFLAAFQATMYFKYFQPFFSVGIGYAFLDAEFILPAPESSVEITRDSFLMNGTIGVQYADIHPVYPFLQIKAINYFSELDKGASKAKTFQLAGSAGIRFEF